jgi:hypothetical protein
MILICIIVPHILQLSFIHAFIHFNNVKHQIPPICCKTCLTVVSVYGVLQNEPAGLVHVGSIKNSKN